MYLVLEGRVLAGRQQPGIVGNRLAQRFYPRPVALGKVGQHVAVHQLLDAGMTDPEPHPAVVVAYMRGDRAQPVMTGDAAADLDPDFRRRQFEFVLKHGDVGGTELEEIRGFLNRAPGLVHESGRPQQNDLFTIERTIGSLALKTAAPRSETVTRGNVSDGHEADVVPVVRVFRTGITETDKQAHDAASCRCLLLLVATSRRFRASRRSRSTRRRGSSRRRRSGTRRRSGGAC